MFRRKKAGAIARLVKQIREVYMYCKIWLAEQAATTVARRYMIQASALSKKGNRWLRFKTQWQGRKYFAQAAICRYARRSGTYKNL